MRDDVVLLSLRPTPVTAARPIEPGTAPASKRVERQVDDVSPPVSRDTAASASSAPREASVESPTARVGPLTPNIPERLRPTRGPGAEWYVAPRARNPFVPAGEASAAERDSTLAALGAHVPAMAARRVPTQGERDARAKEALLKMRLAGRPLLVPPDNSGGIITASISLPFLAAGPSKVRRHRDSVAVAADRAVLERLRQRADSLRRSRDP